MFLMSLPLCAAFWVEHFRPLYGYRTPAFSSWSLCVCPVLFNGWRNVAWDGLLGELSYPMYISHVFVGEALRRVVPDTVLAQNLLYVASVVAFSWVLFVLVGLPIDRLRARFGARIPTVQSDERCADCPLTPEIQA